MMNQQSPQSPIQEEKSPHQSPIQKIDIWQFQNDDEKWIYYNIKQPNIDTKSDNEKIHNVCNTMKPGENSTVILNKTGWTYNIFMDNHGTIYQQNPKTGRRRKIQRI